MVSYRKAYSLTRWEDRNFVNAIAGIKEMIIFNQAFIYSIFCFFHTRKTRMQPESRQMKTIALAVSWTCIINLKTIVMKSIFDITNASSAKLAIIVIAFYSLIGTISYLAQ